MFSLDSTLDNFVTPVAICEAETDLGNILNIFARTKADVLAVSLRNNNWGIIRSQNLLGFLAEYWQKNPAAIIGYPKKFSDAESGSLAVSSTAFDSSIEPAIVCFGHTKLADFFASQNNNFFAAEKDIYLIKNRAGNLQGKLDLPKLLQYLAGASANLKVLGREHSLYHEGTMSEGVSRRLKGYRDSYGTLSEDPTVSYGETDDKVCGFPAGNVLPKRLNASFRARHKRAFRADEGLSADTGSAACMPRDRLVISRSRLNNVGVKPRLAKWQDALSNSLDFLALPFKLETTEGKEIYLSKNWQELINRQPNEDIEQLRSNTSIASWWIEQQLDRFRAGISSTSNSNTSTSNNEYTEYYCCLDNRYYLQDGLNLLSQVKDFDRLNSTKLQHQADVVEHYSKTPPRDKIESELPVSPDNIYFQQGAKWNYLRIPVSLNTQQSIKDKTNRTTYWLVLAIAASRIKERESDSLALVNDSTTIDRLLATISHELKSPLTGIVGLSSLLKAQTIGTLNQRQNQYIQLIYNGSHKLMNIVNDLIELTSLTTGKINLKSEPIDLQSWCVRLYDRVLIKLKSINDSELAEANLFPELQLNISPELTTVIADRTRLSALVSHLILETVKFSDSRDILNVYLKIFRTDNGIVMLFSNYLGKLPLQQSWQTKSDFSQSNTELNINMVMAKYLAKIIGSEVQSLYRGDRCQFSLLIPQSDNLESKLDRSLQTRQNDSSCDLTILCLYLESEAVDSELLEQEGLNNNLKHWVEQDWSNYDGQQLDYRHRIIEADGLEQARTLARIWQIDVIVLDSHQIANPDRYLRSLQRSEYLSALPIITLDTKTTEAANRIEGLNVYPCLLPAQCRSIKDLMQVIQIATGKESKRQ